MRWNGAELPLNESYPYTLSPTMAQRLAKNKLIAIAAEGIIHFDTGIEGYNHCVGDHIMINETR